MSGMRRALLYALFGYLCGSVLFARVFARLLGKKDCFLKSEDKNPGTTNAFIYGGFLCGLLTLTFDLSKGFLPVFLYAFGSRTSPEKDLWLAVVLASPVIGSAFPIYYKFRGGKGVAASFGCALGLLPYCLPLAILAFSFLFLVFVLKISPDIYRTAAAFIAAPAAMFASGVFFPVVLGFAAIAATVCLKLCMSGEKRENMKVRLLWMR